MNTPPADPPQPTWDTFRLPAYSQDKGQLLMLPKLNQAQPINQKQYYLLCEIIVHVLICSAWSKPKVNTKIGLHTTTTHHHNKLFDQFQATERNGVWYITIL